MTVPLSVCHLQKVHLHISIGMAKNWQHGMSQINLYKHYLGVFIHYLQKKG